MSGNKEFSELALGKMKSVKEERDKIAASAGKLKYTLLNKKKTDGHPGEKEPPIVTLLTTPDRNVTDSDEAIATFVETAVLNLSKMIGKDS